MAVQDNLELVRRAYVAFSAGDVATLREVFAPDVVHTVAGSSPISGAHKGVENVLAMYGQLAERSGGTVHVELEDLLSDGGDRVVSVHRARAERNGRTLDQREVLLCTIANGKVVEIQDFFADIERTDSFWA